MAYTKYSLTPANNTAAPPDGAPEGMLPSAVNDTMRDMMAQIRDCGDGIRDGTYTMTAPKITGGTITGVTFSSIVVTGGSITGITDLAVADGGTGASTAANARTNLSAAASGANSDITSLTGLTTPLSQAQGGTGTTTGYYGFKNRIINGAMVIDQRNAGASVSGNSVYTLDRWFAVSSVTNKYTVQQNAGSVTPPVGFTNYLGITSSSAYSVAASDYFFLSQPIEGFNVDLGYGTANAKTVTLSFQVYSSLTGTFGGSFRNSAGNRGYPFSYSIPVANTWTQISITIAGDTTGTWLTTNGIGIECLFGLGVGSNFSGTAGAWAAANRMSATGATSVVGTNGATFYITGVQLEVGSTATSFDYRPYGTEFALCQRYYQASIYSGSSLTIGGGGVAGGNGSGLDILTPLVVTMRTSPTVSVPTVSNGYFAYNTSGGTTLTNSGTGVSSSPTMVAIRFGGFSSVASWSYVESRQTGAGYTASAEL